MSDASPSPQPQPSPGVPSFSARLCRRYSITLPDDLADWFDSGIWQHPGGSEYGEAVDPSVLLAEAPEVIWPALMPPDLLPLIGNTAGDWLCLRVDGRSRGSTILQWYHGGGDWISWGDSLAGAIALDHVAPRLPGPGRRHSVPAEEPRGKSLSRSKPSSPWISDWAGAHLPEGAKMLFAESTPPPELAAFMIDRGIAEVAVRCECVQAELADTGGRELSPDQARAIGVDWQDAVEWSFDPDRIPEKVRRRMVDLLCLPSPESHRRRDWELIAAHSAAVTASAPEHAWAWDLLGYASERRGDRASATRAYRQGLHCSVFGDQSVRLRTHWASSVAAKFSAARLDALATSAGDSPHASDAVGDSLPGNVYQSLLRHDDPAERRRRVTEYWHAIAAIQLENGNHVEAHRCFVAAGWDLGADPMRIYGEILDGVARSADACGWSGRAEVARTHRRCLHQRYGV